MTCAELLAPTGLLAQLLRLLNGLCTDLLRLLDGLRTFPRPGSGATACLLSLVLDTTRGRGLSAQRVDRVVDKTACLLVQGVGDTIRGSRWPPVPSTTKPQHQQNECHSTYCLALVCPRHLWRLLGSPHADLLRRRLPS